MTANYEAALNEFRDASAAVRVAFGKIASARELQIIADSQHRQASREHEEAVARLERADVAFREARDAAAAPPPPPAPRVTQADIDAIEAPVPNGVVIEADPADMGIG